MASSSIGSSARLRLNRAWYLGTYVLCLVVGAMTVVFLAVASRSQSATDATLPVPVDELAMGVLALVVWLGVLAAVAWWAFRSYRRLAGSPTATHKSTR